MAAWRSTGKQRAACVSRAGGRLPGWRAVCRKRFMKTNATPERAPADPLVRPVRQPNDLHPDDDPPTTDRRLPHERDQSYDSQQRCPDAISEQAYEDARKDLPDMDRQPPMQDAYRRQQDDMPATQPSDGGPTHP